MPINQEQSRLSFELIGLAYFVERGPTVTEDDVAKSAHALEIMQRRGLGDLADRMGIQLKS